MNSIGDMQNEKDFYGYYNEFEYNHDYVNMMKYSSILQETYYFFNNIIVVR